jgi:hypothetical protein
VALIRGRLAEVEDQLVAVVAGASLCTLSRSGGPVDGAKYLEGRTAALRQALREVRAAPDAAAPGSIGVIVGMLGDQWRRELDGAVDGDKGRSWIAYRAGGVDELTGLVAAFEESGAPPSSDRSRGSRPEE